jgi:VanZ family protein
VKTDAAPSPAPAFPAAPSSSRLRRFLRYWLPVVLWMSLIFGMSTNAGAPNNTSRIIGPIVRWLVPGISDEALGRVVFTVRKTSHVAEYAVLALLCWRARRKPMRGDARPWNWAEAAFAFAFAVAFAASDEWHQSFVPSRQASAWDVLLDAGGAALGLFVLRRLGRWFKRW